MCYKKWFNSTALRQLRKIKYRNFIQFAGQCFGNLRFLQHFRRFARNFVENVHFHKVFTLALHEKFLYSAFFWSVFSPKGAKLLTRKTPNTNTEITVFYSCAIYNADVLELNFEMNLNKSSYTSDKQMFNNKYTRNTSDDVVLFKALDPVDTGRK